MTNYYVGEKKIQPALEGKPILNHTPKSMLSSQCHALETTEFLSIFSQNASAEFCLGLQTKPNAVLKEQSQHTAESKIDASSIIHTPHAFSA